MATKDFIGFTVDIKAFVNLMWQDATTRAELLQGVTEARNGELLPLTHKLGAANLSGGSGDEAEWYGLFASNVRDAESTTFYRNKTKDGEGKGDRIQMRLRRQKAMGSSKPAATKPLPGGIAELAAKVFQQVMAMPGEVSAAEVAALVAKSIEGSPTPATTESSDSTTPELNELQQMAINTL